MVDDTKNPMGITVLHEGGESPQADIIAIHGLNGGSESTWTEDSDGRKIMWLRDLLPHKLPKCRIMTYGYNANPMDGSRGTIRTHAHYFLESMDGERSQRDEDIRPIIFLAHSLGGLVVKHALIHAGASKHYQPIHTATYGILFFGTPHRGSSKANLAVVLGRVAAAVSGSVRSPLIEALRTDSETLHNLNDSFAQLRFQIVSFFETLPTSPFSGLVVDENSVKIGLHEEFEKSLQLNLSHCNLCKFRDGSDVNFKMVSNNIERFVSGAVKKNYKAAGSDDSNGRTETLTYPSSTSIDGQDPRYGLPAIAVMPQNPPRIQQPRLVPVIPVFSQPSQFSLCLPKSLPKPKPTPKVPKNTVQLPKVKSTNLQALKAEKVDLEHQCHQLNQKLRDIGMRRQQKEVKRAKLKSLNGGQVQQQVRDKINKYGNELSWLEDERVGLESKKRKAIKRLELIERDLQRST